jgi:transposase
MMRSLFSILNLKCGQAEEAEEEKGEVQRSQVSRWISKGEEEGGLLKGKKRKEKKRARYPEQRCE